MILTHTVNWSWVCVCGNAAKYSAMQLAQRHGSQERTCATATLAPTVKRVCEYCSQHEKSAASLWCSWSMTQGAMYNSQRALGLHNPKCCGAMGFEWVGIQSRRKEGCWEYMLQSVQEMMWSSQTKLQRIVLKGCWYGQVLRQQIQRYGREEKAKKSQPTACGGENGEWRADNRKAWWRKWRRKG